MAELELVRFQDGLYGVRKRSWLTGETFADLKDPKFWWRIRDRYFLDCRGSADDARQTLAMLTDHGEPVKEGDSHGN